MYYLLAYLLACLLTYLLSKIEWNHLVAQRSPNNFSPWDPTERWIEQLSMRRKSCLCRTRTEVWWVAELCFQPLNMRFVPKKTGLGCCWVTKPRMKLKLLEVPKKHGEILFFLIWRTSAGKTSVSSTVWIFLCALFMLRPWDVARPSVEMVSRFLGFSLRNLVSRRCRRFGWRSKASGRMCAASARNFWIVVLWKSGIPDVENGLKMVRP